jgi:hypothetical protein
MTPSFPPYDVMPWTQGLFTALNFGLLLVVVVAVGFNCWKHRDWIPAWLLVGGLLGVCLEPIMDVVGLIWYPPQGNWAVLHMHGVCVPVLCVAGYVWLYGGLGGLSYILLRNGASRTDLFRAFVALMVFLMAIEFVGSGTGVYHYYGDQPLRIFHYVAYQGFVNAAIPIIIGVTVHLLQLHVTGWRAVLVIPVVPFAIGASFFGGGFPVFLVVNNPPLPWVVTQLAGVLTCLLCAGSVWIMSRAIPPERRTSGGAAAAKPTDASPQPQR